MKLYINNDIQNKLSIHEKENASEIIDISIRQIDMHHNNVSIFIPEDIYSTSLTEGITLRNWLDSQSKAFKIKTLTLLGRQKKWSKIDNDDIAQRFLIANKSEDDLVCENALGHCWHRKFNNDDAICYSIDKIKWADDMISVEEKKDDGTSENYYEIKNFKHNTTTQLLEFINSTLENAPLPTSWEETYAYLVSSCKYIYLCGDSFTPMFSYPFSKSVSDQIIRLISILNYIEMHSTNGELDREGNEIYQQHFNKKNSDFSSEKGSFKFKNIMSDGESRDDIDFPYHGKIETHHDPIRIHFTWPRIKKLPINVLYVGCKLTKK